LTGHVRLNIIGKKLVKTILAKGERKRGLAFPKKEILFLASIVVFLLSFRNETFHLVPKRRQG